MVYDSVRHRAVLFGGAGNFAAKGDTWEYDGNSWTQIVTPGPPPRPHASASFDPIRGRLVLFGGGYRGSGMGDTWEYDGVTWTQRFPAHSPPPRQLAAMTWDSVAQRTLLFGGRGGRQELALRDTWSWDGTDWTELTTGGYASGGYLSGMQWDPVHRHAVLIGSSMVSLYGSWTWLFDGTSWYLALPAHEARGRYGSAIVFDEQEQRVIAVGGDEGFTVYGLPLMWLWDGTDWTEAPGPRSLTWASAAYDVARRKLVVFGGQENWSLDETWEY